MADLEKLQNAILTGDQKTAVSITEEALAQNVDPQELINDAMIPAMSEAGDRFECEEFFVPELLLAARAMKGALALLQPLLKASGAKPKGRVVIGTVKGDLHDIGKNLVASMLEGAGFQVIDLGADVSADKFVTSIREENPDLVCMSALLTVTMPSMKKTIEALRTAGLREQVKVLIGGAPVTPEYASEVGADGYADNASSAVAKARELMAVAA
jgi:5-methyltetrahydrofolate--homocysteine methyltransferase